jgi:site-specific DNA-methyltransferase (adenine-specific)
MNDYINITCEDNMALMARYPDNHFDLAIVDPPYGIGRDGQAETFVKNPKHKRKQHKQKKWDKSTPSKEYFSELFRVSRNQIIWGGNYFTENLPASMGWVYWDKGQKLTMSDGELAFSSFDRALRSITINRCRISDAGGSIHPTQKPVALYQWLLTNYAKPGDKILDTHIGSGSIAIAVDSVNKIEKMNLTLTGCELDPEYYTKAIERIKAKTSQKSLFNADL